MSAVGHKDYLYYLNSAISLIIMVGFGFLPPFDPITPVGMKLVGIFIGALWAWSTIGLLWPSLVAMLLMGFSGYATVTEVMLQGFGSSTTLLVFFILIFSACIDSAGITEYMALWLVKRKTLFGHPWRFTFILLLSATILASTVNTLAAMVMCWSILYGVCRQLGYQPKDRYPTLMVIGITLCCLAGLAAFPYKVIAAAILGSFQASFGVSISYGAYIAVVWPLILLTILIFTAACKFIFRPDVGPLAAINADSFAQEVQPLSKLQKIMLGFLLALIVLLIIPSFLPKAWLLARILNGLGATGIITAMVTLMVFIPINGQPLLNFKQMVFTGVQWDALILTAAVMPLSAALVTPATGLTAFLTNVLTPIFAGKAPILFIILILGVAMLLTNFANNVVVGMLMLPVVFSLAGQLSLNSAGIAVLLTYCCHMAILTPAACPFAAVMHGNKEWVDTKDIYLYGTISLLLVLVAVILVGLPLTKLFM